MRHVETNTKATKSEYISIAEAVQLAGISRSTFYRLLGDKSSGLAGVTFRIPVLKHLRVRRDAFCQWLEGNTKQ